MLRLFSLPDRESPGIRCQMTARSARPFEPKRGSFFFGRRWESGRSNGKPLKPQRPSSAKLYPAAKPPPPGSVGRAGCASDPKADPLLSTFPSVIFSFWERITRILLGKFPTSRKDKKNERSKMGQSWAISDGRWGWLKVDNQTESGMHKMRKKR